MLKMCLGRVLGLWAADIARWRVSAIAVFRGQGAPPAIEFEDLGKQAAADPKIIHETVYGRARRERHIVARYAMDVALGAREPAPRRSMAPRSFTAPNQLPARRLREAVSPIIRPLLSFRGDSRTRVGGQLTILPLGG